jgi:hypothetical protein
MSNRTYYQVTKNKNKFTKGIEMQANATRSLSPL